MQEFRAIGEFGKYSIIIQWIIDEIRRKLNVYNIEWNDQTY